MDGCQHTFAGDSTIHRPQESYGDPQPPECYFCGDKIIVAACCSVAGTYALAIDFDDGRPVGVEWFGGTDRMRRMASCPWCGKRFELTAKG